MALSSLVRRPLVQGASAANRRASSTSHAFRAAFDKSATAQGPARATHLSQAFAAAVSAAPSQTSSGLNTPVHYVAPQQAYESIIKTLDAAAAAAKQAMRQKGEAVPELTLSLDAYVAVAKKAASKKLEVSRSILATPDPEGAKQRQASCSLMCLSLDNNTPHLDWTALHPAFGVPLLHAFINMGSADSFGLPVFLDQPQQPFVLGLAGYHTLLAQQPQFVGRFLEHYWDDTVTAEPHPFPVMSASELAQEVLSVPVLESVLGGFDAGRSVLQAVQGLGLSGFGAAGGGVKASGGVGAAAASWWDLFASHHPCAALGVFYLSLPNTPLGAFVRMAAARVGHSSSKIGSNIVGSQHVCEPLSEAVCGDVAGGRVWGRGQLTAVGDGFLGGAGGWSGLLPVCESRERDEGVPALVGAGPAEGWLVGRRGP